MNNGSAFHELVAAHPPCDASKHSSADRNAAQRCKVLLSVDDAYAGILATLERFELLDNTYVLVTSDHGFNLGNHMLSSGKFLPYDHALHIPMLFMGPGIAPNSTLDVLGTQVDLAPTILGLAGIDTPDYMDGRSVASLLVDKHGGSAVHSSTRASPATRTSICFEYYNQGRWPRWPHTALDDWSNTYVGIHFRDSSESWKFAVFDAYGKQSNFSSPYVYQLFDLASDPFELHNVCGDVLQRRPELVAMLNETTYAWFACKGTECPWRLLAHNLSLLKGGTRFLWCPGRPVGCNSRTRVCCLQ